jgi:hypothetical protein
MDYRQWNLLQGNRCSWPGYIRVVGHISVDTPRLELQLWTTDRLHNIVAGTLQHRKECTELVVLRWRRGVTVLES